MASFSDENFSKKLSDLNNSQQSIQTLSLWLIHHRKHSHNIVEVWSKELRKGEPIHVFLSISPHIYRQNAYVMKFNDLFVQVNVYVVCLTLWPIVAVLTVAQVDCFR